ncbi:MAG: FAD-dependent oxidoreductase, partial [Ahrensia sp.]
MNRPSPDVRTADRVAIVGAGMAGIASAIRLSAAGFQVTVYDKADAPGGKMRLVQAGQSAINAGPTVFTMKWVFERLLADAGVSLEGIVSVRKAE